LARNKENRISEILKIAIFFNTKMPIGKNKISLKEAAEITGYHPDYLSQLIRKGKLNAERFGRSWVTSREDVNAYLVSMKFVSADKAFVKSKKHSVFFIFSYALIVLALMISVVYYFLSQTSKKEKYIVKDENVLDVKEIGSEGENTFD
jgi:excisionase family DNA binding protein